MSRYLGPRVRLIRKLGPLPGLTAKNTSRTFPPGQHGVNKTGKNNSLSEYGLRLNEKQKLRYNYGLTERQLFNYILEARRLPGATGALLLQLLELRLDNIIYRLGYAPTIPAARQLVNHGGIFINGRRVDIPSFQCQVGDIISIKQKPGFLNLVKNNLNETSVSVPNFLEFDSTNLIGKVISIPDRKDILLDINELLIVEFYSRK